MENLFLAYINKCSACLSLAGILKSLGGCRLNYILDCDAWNVCLYLVKEYIQ